MRASAGACLPKLDPKGAWKLTGEEVSQIVAFDADPEFTTLRKLEELREIFSLPPTKASVALDAWLAWASRSQLTPFVKLARTSRQYRASIEATIEWKLNNSHRGVQQRRDRPDTQRRPRVPRPTGVHHHDHA